MLYEMKLKPEEFDNIKYKNKIIEVRLNDDKRKRIKIGDKINFHRLPELNESILVKVEKLYTFLTFEDIYKSFPVSYFGYDDLETDQILKKIYSIYSKSQERENGVIAIMFRVET